MDWDRFLCNSDIAFIPITLHEITSSLFPNKYQPFRIQSEWHLQACLPHFPRWTQFLPLWCTRIILYTLILTALLLFSDCVVQEKDQPCGILGSCCLHTVSFDKTWIDIVGISHSSSWLWSGMEGGNAVLDSSWETWYYCWCPPPSSICPRACFALVRTFKFCTGQGLCFTKQTKSHEPNICVHFNKIVQPIW